MGRIDAERTFAAMVDMLTGWHLSDIEAIGRSMRGCHIALRAEDAVTAFIRDGTSPEPTGIWLALRPILLKPFLLSH